jgi:hypothetical protein
MAYLTLQTLHEEQCSVEDDMVELPHVIQMYGRKHLA